MMTRRDLNRFTNFIIGNCFSSVFAGFGVFAFLGHMAFKNCMTVDQVVKSGPGLAFIAYPEALGLLPGSQAFSALFFVMMILLGIDSQFAHVDVPVAAIIARVSILMFDFKL